MTNTEVLIVGAGPTGLSAGLFLHQLGIPFRILEKEEELSEHSKAFGVNPRTLSLLESTGVTEQLLAQGHRMTGLKFWQGDRTFFELDLTKIRHRFPFMLIHSQAESEALLAEALHQRGIFVEHGSALVDTYPEQHGMTSLAQDKDGVEQTINSRWVLGADGPRSTVREKMGIDFPGTSWPENWKILDLELDPPMSGDHAHLFLHDQGAIFLIRLEDNLWRVAGNVPDLLNHLPPGTDRGKVHWESDFTMSHRLANPLMKDGVVLAGDAAHVHSPLGARGMNLGIEDAYVFAHLVAQEQVERYDSLRRPAVQNVIRQVKRITQMARGKTFVSRAFRWVTPIAGFLLPFVSVRLRRLALGLDHEVKLPRRSSASVSSLS